MNPSTYRLLTQLLLLWCLLFGSITVSYAEEPTLPSYTNEELLTQMLVVDVSERSLDNVPALAITFSQDVEPTLDFASFVTLTVGGKQAEGAWVLVGEPRRLYFTAIQPQTDYRVQIRPGFSSRNGLQLQKPIDRTVKTRDVQPAFDFATKGSILPTKLTAGLPIRVINVPELDLEFLRVQPDKLPEVVKAISLGENLTQWQMDEIKAVTESVFARRYLTDAKPNARTTLVIPVENITELQTPGLYFAVMRQPGRFGDEAYRVSPFVVTNMGLHLRLYPRGVEVFANALDSGQPLAGVTLTLRGEKETLEQQTNAKGQASFAQRPQGTLLLTAMQDNQFAFLDLREAALDLSEYAVAGPSDHPLAPFIYSGRNLFRPGETVDLSVLLRDRDGQVVDLDRLHLRVVRPDTKPLLEETLVASNRKLGYFAHSVPIPADAPTGGWKAEVRTNAKDAEPMASFAFHVEDFMPERMRLTLKSENKVLGNGDKWTVAVQGDYLYGAPAAGNKLTAVRTVAVNRHPLDTLKDYHFGDPADEKLIGREDLPEVQLSDRGGAFLEVPPLAGKVNSPLTIGAVASLYETGGRTVTRKLETAFWPGQGLVGIRPTFAKDTVAANSPAGFDLVRVSADGKPNPGSRPLAVTLVREEHEYFWEYNSAEGWQRKDVSNEYPLSQQKITLDANAQGKASFEVQDGYYRLEVEDAETGLKTVYPFHAGWVAEGSVAARPDQITLALDKPSYRAGDVVKLTMTPPAAGEAIVAVEGESLLWSQRVALPAGSSTIEVPVDPSWNRHDLYITVTAFRPGSSQQKISPNRALGVVFLPLDRTERKLGLSIDAPEKVLPEQTVAVTVRAENLAQQEAVVTLAAVDVGVLNITDFKTPDPFNFYFTQHGYGVNLHDAYGKIIEYVEGAAVRQRFGGDAMARRAGGLPPAGVQIVSLFSGAVSFDAEGKAKIDLPLPGFDGTLRLMAVAATANRFGSAEREMKVASPVVASLAAPRFLATGDSSFVTVDLNNTTEANQVVKFTVEADPALNFAPVQKEEVLTKGQRKALTFPVTTQQALGAGNVKLTLSGNGFTARRQVAVAVRPAFPAKHTGLHRELEPGEALTLDSSTMQGFLAAGLRTEVNLSATPALPLRGSLQGLLQYPYGCLEQTTSTAWPYLFLEADVAERLGLTPLAMKERSEKVNAALLRIAGMQLSGGGFSLWGGNGDEEYWLTPYVVDFLLDAKGQGFTVPDWLLQRAIQNLQERLQETEPQTDRYTFSEMPEHLAFAARAYAGYVLARHNKQATIGTLRVMQDKDSAMAKSGLPLVHLGLALTIAGDHKRGAEAIQKGLAMVRDDKLYAGDYGSQLRDEAAVVYLLLRHKVDVPQLAERINTLAGLLHNRQYFSTQEQLFTFLAGLKVQEKAREPWKAKLGIGGDNVDLAGSGAQVRALTPDELGKGVSISAAGNAPLYVSAMLDGYPDTPPAVDADPIDVKREWHTMQGKKVQAQDLKAGDLLLVHLTVSSHSDINDALVVDLLPAGFEIENTNLSDNETLQGLQLEGAEKPLSELLESSSPRTQAFRDDRYVAALPLEAKARHHLFYRVRVVSKGEFAVPPPYAEDMYRPELNGIGSTGEKLSIKP